MKKINIGVIVITLLSVSPIVPWLFAVQPITLRFSNFYNIMISISQVLGLVGVSMFALSMVLSMRLKFFENFFGGMNKVYVFHHLFGSIAFILLLFHPLSYAMAFAQFSIKTAATSLLPGPDWSINFGLAALLGMMSLLILTFFVNIPYQVWKLTHQYLGLVFFIAAIHGFYVSSGDIAQNNVMKIYMLCFFTIGLGAYTYRTLLGRFLIKKFAYSVSAVKQLEDNVVEISLTPKSEKMPFVSGQFVFLRFQSNGVTDEIHPFSISSNEADNTVTFSVKAEGDYTRNLKNLVVGDTAYMEGSFGRFSFKTAMYKNQIWIAGGIGITPFFSMARSLNDPSYSITLYYSVRTEKEAVYLQELQQIAQTHANFRVMPFFTKTQGRLKADMIAKLTQDIKQNDIFICGPPPMMHSMREQLHQLGVLDEHIHTEEFAML